MTRLLPAALLAAFALPAFGSTILGNPNKGITNIGPSKIYVHQVLATQCVTNEVHPIAVGETLLADDSVSFTLPLRAFCAMEVEVVWAAGNPVVSIPVGGFTTLKINPVGPLRTVEIDPATQTATLY